MGASTLKIIDEALDGYESLDSLARKELIQNIQKIAEIERKELAPSEFICPITKQGTVCSCNLQKCKYWVEHPWTKNCALHFMNSQQKGSLSTEQVSLLYRKSPERIDSIYKRCFKIVQRHYLRDTLRNRYIPQFKFIPGFCVTCQSLLVKEDLEDPNLRIDSQFGYCSVDCKKQFSPHYFEIERFFEAPFFRVVEIGSETFNFYYLEDILGFQPNVLRNRLEKLREDA